MHIYILPLICFAILFTEGYGEDYDCEKNVPGEGDNHESVRGILLKAINSVRSEMGSTQDLVYDCHLANDAFMQTYTDNGEGPTSAFMNFNGESMFNYNWEESLEEAVKNAKENAQDGMLMSVIPSVAKVGCALRLSTDEDAKHRKVRFHFACPMNKQCDIIWNIFKILCTT
ncbi:hypothetical protein GCK32_003523 [Trichostrongylus colubriformis]|uniref:SCP domain-containing protein n=1 Tax=Trichostrongylus colubriformis TaxID=6319 RepID=A0AAN8J1J1_TRICO